MGTAMVLTCRRMARLRLGRQWKREMVCNLTSRDLVSLAARADFYY